MSYTQNQSVTSGEEANIEALGCSSLLNHATAAYRTHMLAQRLKTECPQCKVESDLEKIMVEIAGVRFCICPLSDKRMFSIAAPSHWENQALAMFYWLKWNKSCQTQVLQSTIIFEDIKRALPAYLFAPNTEDAAA